MRGCRAFVSSLRRKASALWKESQHKHAVQHASAAAVLGDFDNASFDYYGVHSRFFKKDNKFLVETDGPDGKLATFEIKYTGQGADSEGSSSRCGRTVNRCCAFTTGSAN